ncbi:MAG: DUF1624 domain-containing protein [Gemmobacter sp.]
MVAGRGRLVALDLAKTAALVCMAVYHLAYDLEMFGLVAPGTVLGGVWLPFSRAIAGSFLCLAGVSLWLAHGRGIRRGGVVRRFVIVGGAAAGITLVTFLAMPDRFIFFGILHMMAFAGVAGLAFVMLPAWAVAGVALAVWGLPRVVFLPLFDTPLLQWVGLGTIWPRTVDYVPVFPWFGAVLAGIALARVLEAAGVWDRLRGVAFGRVARALAWPGRHSLAVYLIHQPVLIGAIWLWLRVTG